ncbi:21524_t:CDS:2 [Cetraspora pellucida]|uniref:21524_t:CDS:1 n=1 Tax=Cetraspora pellucida TaxID=1433469 RepID=A0A9N9CDI5_9GLOM|nr:21524_t:CDS:2 [Cetraspora pellucida]
MPVFTSLALSCAVCFISGSLIILQSYLEIKHKQRKLVPPPVIIRINHSDKNVEKLKDVRSLGTTPVNHNVIYPVSKKSSIISSSYPQRISHNPPSRSSMPSSCPIFLSFNSHTPNFSVKKSKRINPSSTSDSDSDHSVASSCFAFTQDLFALCEYFNMISVLAGLNSMFQSI